MRFDEERTSRSTFDGRRNGALFVILSAAIAALVAHIGIDVAGDYVLAHDSYDGIEHGSRLLITVSLLVALVVVAVRVVCSALDRVVGVRRAMHECAPSAVPKAIGRHLVLVVVATFVLLVGMERVDLLVAGQPPDDLADLLGGSFALGIGLTLPLGLAVAAAGWSIARWIRAARLGVIEIVGAWMMSRARHRNGLHTQVRRSRRAPIAQPVFARNTSKRGPPHLRSFA